MGKRQVYKWLPAYMSDVFLLLWQEVTYLAANTAQCLLPPRRRRQFSLFHSYCRIWDERLQRKKFSLMSLFFCVRTCNSVSTAPWLQ